MVARALIVQSRPDVARVVSAALAADCEALVVAHSDAAVEAVESWDPDVVLVDLTLPPLDGWYVLSALGACPGRGHGRPLLVVRVANASEAERAIGLGADAWVDDDVHIVAAAGRLFPQIAA